MLPGDVCQQGTTEVGHILAERKAAIDVYIVDRQVLGVLVPHARYPLLERLGVRRRPPVLQIALRIELPAFIVEAVRQLVSYGRACVCRNSEPHPFSDRIEVAGAHRPGNLYRSSADRNTH